MHTCFLARVRLLGKQQMDLTYELCVKLGQARLARIVEDKHCVYHIVCIETRYGICARLELQVSCPRLYGLWSQTSGCGGRQRWPMLPPNRLGHNQVQPFHRPHLYIRRKHDREIAVTNERLCHPALHASRPRPGASQLLRPRLVDNGCTATLERYPHDSSPHIPFIERFPGSVDWSGRHRSQGYRASYSPNRHPDIGIQPARRRIPGGARHTPGASASVPPRPGCRVFGMSCMRHNVSRHQH